jgi:propanol-preferring alcohol dehydrogenase
VLACGVCRTDVHVAEGDLPLRAGPVVPGHQVVGVVEAHGQGVDLPRIGDRVGVTWLASTCGRCAACLAGRENLCAEARFTGWDRDGGFAERAVARADFCVALPAALSPLEAAPLLCAGVIGYRALRLSGVTRGERLGLVGFGASAHLALQAARARGCEVFVFTRGERHRKDALALGAAWAGPLGDGPAGGPAECDAVVTFAPSGDVVPAALAHVRPGGTVAINAVHLSDIPSFPYERLFGERVLRSVSNLTRADAREFLELAASAPVRAHPVAYPFDRANDALRDVAESRLEGQAVLEIAS